jgi:hypothetical protein
MSDFHSFDLHDREWGVLRILRVVGRGGEWGVLAPLRGTSWKALVSVVSGEAMSHALHRWATPLSRELGPPPSARIKRVPKAERWCELYLQKNCILRGEKCYAGGEPPECYEASGVERRLVIPLRRVVLAVSEGRYTVVVQGPEFSL